MRRIKRIIFVIGLCIGLSVITGCSCKKTEKKFTKEGITITLDSSFSEDEDVAFQVVYLSKKFGFSGNGEKKASLIGIHSLKEYMNIILKNAQKEDSTIQEYQSEGSPYFFLYTYFDAIVQEREFSYMLITKEGESKYYVMKLWCQKKDFNHENKEKMLNWAKSIIVE